MTILKGSGELLRVGQRVLEIVRMFALVDLDVELARDAGELSGAGVGNDGDGELRRAAGHDTGVVEEKCSVTARERAFDALDRDVDARAFHGRSAGEHLAVACAFEIAVKLLVEQHATERSFALVVGRLRREFDVECAACVHSGWLLLAAGFELAPENASDRKKPDAGGLKLLLSQSTAALCPA